MTIKRKDFLPNTVLNASDVEQVQDNGAIQVDNISERNSLPLSVRLCFVTSNQELYKQDNAGVWTRVANQNDLDLLAMSTNPLGSISMWYGTPGQITTGWTLCDGTKPANAKWTGAVPDLRGRGVTGVSDGTVGSPTGGVRMDGIPLGHVFGHDRGRFRLAESQVAHRAITGATNQGYHPWTQNITGTRQQTDAHRHHIPLHAKPQGKSGRTKRYMYDSASFPQTNGVTGFHSELWYHNHNSGFSGVAARAAQSDTHVTQPTAGVHYIMFVGVK